MTGQGGGLSDAEREARDAAYNEWCAAHQPSTYGVVETAFHLGWDACREYARGELAGELRDLIEALRPVCDALPPGTLRDRLDAALRKAAA